ncbi:hypothetical protein DMC30DRAFT_416997 [Rhodotorula diobovata]|uniref:F-box domain-containing protein n=1 Tax=Rhodotorula diobovata TaxID=5288 RepID=A0A5C5FWL8_9BASI|nr:hypothetical protein DMC30DRAFT_416997 [Rhodotorula diobovata]
MGVPRFISRSRKGLLAVCVGQPPRRIRRHSHPVFSSSTPPGASRSSSLANRLPVELMSEIVSMACDEGRYEDMTTLQAVMQVSRRWYSVAAPRFWRSVNLHLKPTEDLERVGTFLSPRTRAFVKVVKTRSRSNPDRSRLSREGLFASVVAQLPNAEDLEVELDAGAPAGLAMITDLAQTVYPKLTALAIRGSTSSLSWAVLKRALTSVNPSRLVHLHLSELSAFGDEAPSTSFLGLASFENLTHFGISTCQCAGWTMDHLAGLRAPLRSLHLEFDNHLSELQPVDLERLLRRFKSTLEYLYLAGKKVGDPSALFDLPKLRHLRLCTAHALDLLPFFVNAPLEILEVDPRQSILPWLHSPAGNGAHLPDAVMAHAATLQVVLMPDDLGDDWAWTGIVFNLIRLQESCRVVFVWKNEGLPFRIWHDLDTLDDFQRSWKVIPSHDTGVFCAEMSRGRSTVLLCDERGEPDERDNRDDTSDPLHPTLRAVWKEGMDRLEQIWKAHWAEREARRDRRELE